MDYRKDIDGLRTIAVFLVILNHAGFSFFSGGFIGVDVFFVISGFLITGIIFPKIIDNTFNFSWFLSRRIKRLMPVLFFVIFITCIAATLLMFPKDLMKFYYSIIWVTLYAGNFFFWKEHGGYFDGNSQEVPLLHTWSLAIEEQYYIVWPIFLILIIKFLGVKRTLVLSIVSCLAAIILSQWGTEITLGAAYYLLPTRFFELMIGSCLAMFWGYLPNASQSIRNILSIIGAILIFGSALILTKYHAFPGYNALYSVIGTALIIYSSTGWFNKLLTFKPVVFTGNISYSLYLWHWPVFSLLTYSAIEKTLSIQLASIAVIYIISIASWKYIEEPFRNVKLQSFKSVFLKMYFLPAAALITIAIVGISNNGYSSRFSAQTVDMENALNSYSSQSRKNCHSAFRNSNTLPNNVCTFPLDRDITKKANVFIIGDSHANHFVPFLMPLISDAKLVGQDYTLDRCVPIYNLSWGSNDHMANKCKNRNLLAYQYIAENNFDYVVLAASWPDYSTKRIYNIGKVISEPVEKEELFIEQLLQSIKKIVNAGAIPVIIEDTPSLQSKSAKCPLKKSHFNKNLHCDIANYKSDLMKKSLASVRQLFPQTTIIAPAELFCNSHSCSMSIEGIPLYRDDNHLNEIGAMLLGKKFISSHPNPFINKLEN